MSIFDKALGLAGTAKTFAVNFWPWLAGAAAAGLLVGAYPTFLITRAVYQREALRARLDLSNFEHKLDEAQIENRRLADTAASAALENRDANQATANAVAADVRRIGERLQLCATKSDVRVTVTPEGTIATVPDGQLRDAAEAVREFAEACASLRDRDANDHNALIDWLQKVTKP